MPKNRLYVSHPEVVKFPATEFSANIAAGATTGSVLNNADFVSSSLMLIGEYGGEETEIVSCSTPSGSTQVNFFTSKFAHTKGIIATKIEYNQFVLERNTAATGTFTAIATTCLDITEPQSMYVDNTTISDAWYKYRYYDTVLTTYSGYSDAFQLNYKDNSLHEIREMVKLVSGVDQTEENLDRMINWYHRKICSQYNYGFMETTTAASSVASQVEYAIPSDCKLIKGIRVTKDSSYYHPQYLAYSEFKLAQLNTSNASIPDYWTMVGPKYLFHNPFSALGTNNITITYTKFPARLDTDNDVTDIPLADALVNRVAYGLALSTNPEKAQALLGDYQGALNELKAIYGQKQMETFPQVGYGKIEIEQVLEIDTV